MGDKITGLANIGEFIKERIRTQHPGAFLGQAGFFVSLEKKLGDAGKLIAIDTKHLEAITDLYASRLIADSKANKEFFVKCGQAQLAEGHSPTAKVILLSVIYRFAEAAKVGDTKVRVMGEKEKELFWKEITASLLHEIGPLGGKMYRCIDPSVIVESKFFLPRSGPVAKAAYRRARESGGSPEVN